MHRTLSGRPERGERGAVTIVVAAALTGLLVIAAMVLDFGLVRIDRQIDRAAADEATLAGLHALNTGDGTPHPYVGVCTAARYLKANNPRFATISESSGWKNGLGVVTADGCSDTALRNQTCEPGDKASWARWAWTGTSRGVTLDVTIESGYDLAANQWAEDTLPATGGDDGDPAYQGCDNLSVTISQSREPGLGSMATAADLETAIRSVGRVEGVPGDSAPAMLLLKRTGCPVLKTGSSGGGSFVHVLGAVSSDGKTQAGTIHADSDGVGCAGGMNGWVYGGLANTGIVAYAAPLATNPTLTDPGKPGSITSVAAANGIAANRVRDSLDHVHSSSALDGTAGAKTEVTGRGLVTRGLVDERYFDGVKPAIAGASTVFASGAGGAPAGWTPLVAANECKPTQAEMNVSATLANTATGGRLYINCDDKFVGLGTGLSIAARTVYFRGWVNPSGSLKLPDAHHVYIGNHTSKPDAVSLGTGAEFQVHNMTANLDGSGNCTTGQSPNKSVLFVRTGQFKQTGGLLRMCRTTALMMGGQLTGCVPATTGTAPTTTPCASTLGTGQFTQNGGDINWTAPDTLDATTDPATGDPLPTAVSAWHDADGPEDLALWSESGSSSSTNFSMAGGGLFEVRGVFMVPNAAPFIISGGASLDLTNAQYIASSVELNGSGTSITMAVDPNAAITLPDQDLVGLVR